MSDWCKRCDRFLLFESTCNCKPFECRRESHGEEFDDNSPVYALDAERAAKKFVELDWNNDPCNPGDVDEFIEVRDETGIVSKFNVHAEPSVHFYAKEVKDE